MPFPLHAVHSQQCQSTEDRHAGSMEMKLKGSVKEPNIDIFLFPPITQWRSISILLAFCLLVEGKRQILVF